jgi:hypothetical protein
VRELDRAVLQKDIPEHSLCKGDVGTVVMVHQCGAGYEVEFMALDGETVAVVTLTADQLRSIERHEIAHARVLTG